MSGEKKRRRKKTLDKMRNPVYNDLEAAGHFLKEIARHSRGLELAVSKLRRLLETDHRGSDQGDSHPPK